MRSISIVLAMLGMLIPSLSQGQQKVCENGVCRIIPGFQWRSAVVVEQQPTPAPVESKPAEPQTPAKVEQSVLIPHAGPVRSYFRSRETRPVRGFFGRLFGRCRCK
jgi:hypothetical protein